MSTFEKIRQERKDVERSIGRTFVYIAIIPAILMICFIFNAIDSGVHTTADAVMLVFEIGIPLAAIVFLMMKRKKANSRADVVDDELEQLMNSIGFYSETDFDNELSEMENLDGFIYINERYAVNFAHNTAVRMEDVERVEAVKERRRHASRYDYKLKFYMRPDGHEYIFVPNNLAPCDRLRDQFMEIWGK